MRRIIIALVALAALAGAAIAQAEVVNEFNFQITNVKKDGRFTVVFTSRSYDTTGAVPPLLIRNYIRIPVGAKIPKKFLSRKNRRQQCNVAELRLTKLPSTCRRAKIGSGTAKVDARLVINPLTGQPYIAELIPYNLEFYFAKPQEKGAVASFVILALPDTTSPVVNNAGIVRDTKVVLVANFFNDPTPDGRFGYRLEIPAGPVQGFRVSVAEVYVNNPGQTITQRKRKCTRRRHRRCVKRKVTKKKLFWFTAPKCPASKALPFQSFYQYENVAAPQIKELTIPCPDFGTAVHRRR